jgi:hypothetical protein
MLRIIVTVKHSNLLMCFLVVKVKYIHSIYISYTEHILEIIVIVKHSNLLIY